MQRENGPGGPPAPGPFPMAKIKAESRLVVAGRNKARNIEVSPVDQAGWYKFSKIPATPW